MLSALLVFAGCAGGDVSDTGAPTGDASTPAAPLISSVGWACDTDDAEWTLTVETDGWTGGGRLWMGRDADSVEVHRVYSTNARADESTDRLTLDLDIVADWREAVSGSSTRYRCDAEDALSFLLWVYERDGSTESDCRVWGLGEPAFEDVTGSPCEVPLQDTGG